MNTKEKGKFNEALVKFIIKPNLFRNYSTTKTTRMLKKPVKRF